MSLNLRNKLIWLPVALGLLVIAIWAVFGWFLPNPSNLDYFGGVNALFAGLAFVGLISAILLQSEELSLQRKELELTRIELQGQKAQLELQNQTLTKQSLENTFFNLLKSHTDIVAAIDLIDQNKVVLAKGRDCFSIFFRRHLSDAYRDIVGQLPHLTELERIRHAYGNFFRRNQADVGHYFRSLYHIFQFVNSSQIHDKQFYANLVVAQLSSYELGLLFYNCLTSYGNEKFKPLIETFGILENFDPALVFDRTHLEFYSRSAYGRQ